MAAIQNIRILYFSRNPLWYSVDEERDGAVSKDTEGIEPMLICDSWHRSTTRTVELNLQLCTVLIIMSTIKVLYFPSLFP